MVRFALTVSISWLLIWWIILFVFPPAGADFRLVSSTLGKLRALFLTFQTSSNPYSIAQQQWSDTLVSYTVASFRYLVLLGSLIVFVMKGWGVVVRKRTLSLERLMLLSLYMAFGLLVVISVPIDLTGLEAGSNLEYRNLTYFILIATPVFAWGMRDMLAALLHRRARRGARHHGLSTNSLVGFTGILLAVCVVIGIVKCTVDPAVSNQRIFYSSAERQSIVYYVDHSRDDVLWSGPDDALALLAGATFPRRTDIGNIVRGYAIQPYMRDWLSSPQLISNSIAYSFQLPDFADQNRVYDNGEAQLYRVRPSSPFQS